ncbi:hypothetical protein L2E82_39111 [Cichorium intybus]|uniref:Uncharacterized protein n=1 Tax=Cichorium intybus TaxID=13427 RepID=A0ACB9AHY0_CICIN|nr:hypothetical protein L2E82_39111 [Cichorium intybus]
MTTTTSPSLRLPPSSSHHLLEFLQAIKDDTWFLAHEIDYLKSQGKNEEILLWDGFENLQDIQQSRRNGAHETTNKDKVEKCDINGVVVIIAVFFLNIDGQEAAIVGTRPPLVFLKHTVAAIELNNFSIHIVGIDSILTQLILNKFCCLIMEAAADDFQTEGVVVPPPPPPPPLDQLNFPMEEYDEDEEYEDRNEDDKEKRLTKMKF